MSEILNALNIQHQSLLTKQCVCICRCNRVVVRMALCPNDMQTKYILISDVQPLCRPFHSYIIFILHVPISGFTFTQFFPDSCYPNIAMSIVAVHTQLNFQLFVACVTSSDLHELYTIEIFSQNYVGLVSTPQVIAL